MNRTLFVLGVVLAFASSTARADTPRVVLPGTSDSTPFPGHDTVLLSPHTDTPSRTAVLELTVPPRTFGAPPHIHSKEDEHFYVLDGTIEFLDRERTVVAGPGTLVVLPRGHLHGFWNASNAPAHLLLIVTPGHFASFFDQAVARVRESQAADPRAVARITAELAAHYGVEVFPDEIPPEARELLPR